MKGLCNHSIADLFFFIDLDSGVCYTCAKKKRGGWFCGWVFLLGWLGFFCTIVLLLTCGFQTKIKYYF